MNAVTGRSEQLQVFCKKGYFLIIPGEALAGPMLPRDAIRKGQAPSPNTELQRSYRADGVQSQVRHGAAHQYSLTFIPPKKVEFMPT